MCAQVFLPQGNFAYIEQIPDLYADFCKTNNTNDVFEFMEEEFFELSYEEFEADEPHEEGAPKPVPFHAPNAQMFVTFSEPEQTEFINTETIHPHNFIYILKEHWVYTPSVYRPPENKLA